ncbi:MAG: four-carbon acid sugar kinase family protein [Desulfuromonadales bacterium]
MVHAGLRAVIVADDLTGAMDAAAPFARRGLEVRVLTAPEDLKPVLSNPPQVLSINTGTRHAVAGVAAAVVGTLIGHLRALQPKLLIKKIDSTLRGQVVAETIAAMQAANRTEVLIAPAVPAQGRTWSGGELFVDGVPLRDTAIARDLRSPPPVAPLGELLRTVLPDIPVLLEQAGGRGSAACRKPVPCIRIADAATDAQLLALAEAAVDRCGDILFVGAAGLAEALAEALFGPNVAAAAPPALPGAALYVIGSRAPQVAEQVAALCKANPWTRVAELSDAEPLDTGVMQRLAAPGQRAASLVVRAPRATAGRGFDPDLVARALAASTLGLLEQTEVGLLLMTGGDTVLAVLEALGVKVIQVCGEVRPGVVHGLIDTPKGPLRLVTKAGGFGEGQLFCAIEEYFR